MKLNPFKKSNWKDKEETRYHFYLEIGCGIVMALLLNCFVHHTDIGYNILNYVYDYFVRADFRKSLENIRQQNKSPIDSRLRLVIFDKELYETETQGFWTPRDLLGETVLNVTKLGAKVIVVDFAMNRPAPFCQKGPDENQAFLKALADAVKIARDKGSVILLPRVETESSRKKDDYEREFERLIAENHDVIKQSSAIAYQDTSDYQVRHFLFYERTKQNAIFFSIQLLAAVYLWNDRSEGDEIIAKAKEKILSGEKEFEMETRSSVRIYAQDDPNSEYLSARYIFRIAHRDIIEKYPGAEDPCIKYPGLCRDPYSLRNQTEMIYRDKAVIIGSENPEMGDVHFTPIGKLPGVFLIANGLNLFLEGLQIHDPGIVIRVLIEAVCIFISAMLYLYLHALPGNLLLAIFYMIAAFFSLRLFSSYGLLIDLWFPFIGLVLSRLIIDMKSLFHKKEGKHETRTKASHRYQCPVFSRYFLRFTRIRRIRACGNHQSLSRRKAGKLL